MIDPCTSQNKIVIFIVKVDVPAILRVCSFISCDKQTEVTKEIKKNIYNYVFENFIYLCTLVFIFNLCNKHHLFDSTDWLFINIIGVHIIFYCLLTVIVHRRVYTFQFIPYNINFVQRGLTEIATFIEVTSALCEGIKYCKGKGKGKGKSKAIPLQAWTGPEGSRRLRFPDIKTIGT